MPVFTPGREMRLGTSDAQVLYMLRIDKAKIGVFTAFVPTIRYRNFSLAFQLCGPYMNNNNMTYYHKWLKTNTGLIL